MNDQNIFDLMQQFPQQGELVWIGLRPGKKQPIQTVEKVMADTGFGLQGDHYTGRSGKRQVTLFQWEHLQVLESFLGQQFDPSILRRNLMVKGINLLSLKKQRFTIGTVELSMTGLCHPCSRMEEVLGTGGYNAMRNHGGINCQVVRSGQMKIGDELSVVDSI